MASMDIIESGRLTLSGIDFDLDVSGALFSPVDRILIVADLHLEKGSSLAKQRGTLLPPYDTRATLMRLSETIARLNPKTVIALGDTWHDNHGPERLDDEDRAQLISLTSRADFVFVSGNHDHEPQHQNALSIVDEISLGDVTLRHEPQKGARFEIAGHLHPAAKVKARGRALRRRCFIANENRIILPAFGAYTGGLNVRDQAFTQLFPEQDFIVHLLGDTRTYAAAPPQLIDD